MIKYRVVFLAIDTHIYKFKKAKTYRLIYGN
jgi:hypothetical protein